MRRIIGCLLREPRVGARDLSVDGISPVEQTPTQWRVLHGNVLTERNFPSISPTSRADSLHISLTATNCFRDHTDQPATIFPGVRSWLPSDELRLPILRLLPGWRSSLTFRRCAESAIPDFQAATTHIGRISSVQSTLQAASQPPHRKRSLARWPEDMVPSGESEKEKRGVKRAHDHSTDSETDCLKRDISTTVNLNSRYSTLPKDQISAALRSLADDIDATAHIRSPSGLESA